MKIIPAVLDKYQEKHMNIVKSARKKERKRPHYMYGAPYLE
jgi:hypothetical protein